MDDAVVQTPVLVLQLGDLLVLLVIALLRLGDGGDLWLGDEGGSDGLEFCEDFLLEGLQVGCLFGGDLMKAGVLLCSRAARAGSGYIQLDIIMIALLSGWMRGGSINFGCLFM